MRAASTPSSSSSSSSLSAGLRMPKQTWILDSVPGRADLSVHGVLRAVSSLRRPFPSRGWVVNELIGEKHGLDRSLAKWITTGLREETKGGSNSTDGGGGGEGSSSSSSLDWAFDLCDAGLCRDCTRRHDRIRRSRNISSSNSNCRRTDCCWSGCGRPAVALSRGCAAAATSTSTSTLRRDDRFALLRVALRVADIDRPTRHIAHVGPTERRRREGGSISCALSFVKVDQNR